MCWRAASGCRFEWNDESVCDRVGRLIVGIVSADRKSLVKIDLRTEARLTESVRRD